MPKFVRQGNNTLTGNNTFSGTNVFSGAITLSGAVTASGGVSGGAVSATTLTASSTTKTPNRISLNTNTDVDAQNATPTAAQLLGGMVTHTSVTGAGTCTVPTGANMSSGINSAVGSAINWLYYNDGNQTVTITAASGHTLVGGTAAVTTGKHMIVTSVCTATDTWVSFLTTLM